jgi:hypothetical protein
MKTKIKGFDLSVVDLDNDCLAIHFDKDGKTGGYISIKMDDDGVVVDVFSACGDCIGSTWSFYNELMQGE